MKQIVNWGVLGCAGIAKAVTIPAILNAEGARLYALASRSADKLREFEALFHPVKGYTDYDALLADPEVDAVYLPLPNALHAEWAIRAVRAGKPVLCEKPLAMTAGQVREIMAASEETGVPVMEAFAYMHGPMMAKIREILDSGRLGPVRYIESNFSYLLEDLNNVRLIRDIGGGACYDLGCYPLSFFLDIMGEAPTKISTLTTFGERSKCDEDMLAILEFPSGAKASTSCAFSYHLSTRNLIACKYGTIDMPSFFDLPANIKRITVTTAEGRE